MKILTNWQRPSPQETCFEWTGLYTHDSNWLYLYSVAGCIAFFVFVRSGWTLRFTAERP